MSNPAPFQAHIELQVYAATPDDWQRALSAAFEQLIQNVPQSHTVLNEKAGFSFKVTAMNLDDNKPSPAIPPQV